jgi:acetolactate synthase-1/2/3 large subunit
MACSPLAAGLPRSLTGPPRATEFPRFAGLDLIGTMHRVLSPETILCADVTSLAYRLLVYYPVKFPRTFLHPAAAISMGFGLPAALGVKAAFPDRTVVAVMGDGCFQMTGMELATAVQEKLPVVVILINDSTLSLIKAIQQRRYQGRFLGVDLVNPDFSAFARAYGIRSWQVDTDAAFEACLRQAIALDAPALIEVKIGKK